MIPVGPLKFTASEKAALIAFLKTLTDRTFLTDPRFSNPFVDRKDVVKSVKRTVLTAGAMLMGLALPPHRRPWSSVRRCSLPRCRPAACASSKVPPRGDRTAHVFRWQCGPSDIARRAAGTHAGTRRARRQECGRRARLGGDSRARDCGSVRTRPRFLSPPAIRGLAGRHQRPEAPAGEARSSRLLS